MIINTLTVIPYSKKFYHYIINDGDKRTKNYDAMKEFCLLHAPSKNKEIIELFIRREAFMIDLENNEILLLRPQKVDDKKLVDEKLRNQLMNPLKIRKSADQFISSEQIQRDKVEKMLKKFV